MARKTSYSRNRNLTFDLHGVRLEDLDQLIDRMIYQCLSDNKPDLILITGAARLQQRIIELCENVYNYTYHIPFFNKGMIIIRIY
jgi:hypothetical protein